MPMCGAGHACKVIARLPTDHDLHLVGLPGMALAEQPVFSLSRMRVGQHHLAILLIAQLFQFVRALVRNADHA